MSTEQHKSGRARVMRRRRERGTAMVESAVIFPVIVIFLGLMEFVHAEYAAKIEAYNTARYSVWNNVLHACTGATTGNDLGQGSATATGSQANPDTQHQDPAVTGGTQQRFLIKKFKQTATTTASITRGRATYSNSNITAQSSAYCNEPKNNNTNILVEIWRFAKGF